jgi:hypothetical protein
MKQKLFLTAIALFGILCLSGDAFAAKRLLPGKGEGMATVTIKGASLDIIRQAAINVFQNDDYKVATQTPDQIVFERNAGRLKDISYGGLASEEGTLERIEVIFHEEGTDTFRLECNAYMVDKGSFFENSTEVLRPFGKQYQRMLNATRKQALKEAKKKENKK